MFQSLLTPPDAPDAGQTVVPADAVRDLALEEIAHAIGRAGTTPSVVLRLLTHLPLSHRVIEYRQQIIRSLWEDEALCNSVREILQSMKELTLFGRTGSETDRPLLASIWRLGELELYVELVRKLGTLLAQRSPASEGLKLLEEELTSRASDAAFVELTRALPELRKGLKLHQSVTIGINLDDKLRPVEAALLSVNPQRYRQGQFLSGFFRQAVGDEFLTRTYIHQNVADDPFGLQSREKLPLSPLFDELDSVLKAMLKPLARELRKYLGVNTALMRGIVPELGFYIGAVDYFRFLRDAGFAVCFPALAPAADRRSRFTGLYNARLASRWGESRTASVMVGNSVSMDEHARLYVLTGPNGGGKTTFTQAIGIATVLGQAGLAVPAERAELSPVDAILTHFQTDENYEDEIGRFEDEARRLSALFDGIGGCSLVLLNEPLASTSPDEAEAINRSLLEALCVGGARGVVTTHFHGLARSCTTINSSVDGLSAVGTLSAGTRVVQGKTERTFQIQEADPEGQSYALEITRRYGLDRESLRSRISGSSDADAAS